MRPKMFILDLSDPDRSLDDPTLRALVEAGWTCSGSWPVVRNDSADVKLALLLWPPPVALRPRPTPDPAPPNSRESALLYAYPAIMLLAIAAAVAGVLWAT